MPKKLNHSRLTYTQSDSRSRKRRKVSFRIGRFVSMPRFFITAYIVLEKELTCHLLFSLFAEFSIAIIVLEIEADLSLFSLFTEVSIAIREQNSLSPSLRKSYISPLPHYAIFYSPRNFFIIFPLFTVYIYFTLSTSVSL
jgi:hypothetical protein